MTNFAVNKNKIVIFGGAQMRPNLHILDYIRAVNLFISCEDNLIENETFNVGYQNLTINEIAHLVKKVVEKKFPGKSINLKNSIVMTIDPIISILIK